MAALKTLRERSSETKQAVDAARKVRRKAEEELDRARSNHRATQRDRDMCAVALAKAQDAVKNAEVQDGIFATRADQLDETITQLASQLSQATEKLDTCRTAIEGAPRAGVRGHCVQAGQGCSWNCSGRSRRGPACLGKR